MSKASTVLYVVDLHELRTACGSKNPSLIDRVHEAEQDSDGKERPIDYTKGPRIHVAWNSELFLNGQPVTKEELTQSLLDPKLKGTMLYYYMDQDKDLPRGKACQGEFFVEPTSFWNYLTSVGRLFLERGEKFQFCGTQSRGSLKSLQEIGKEDDWISEEDALAELINGEFSKPKCGSDYAYALERVCRALCVHWIDLGENKLKSLKVNTKLSKSHHPVKLPRYSGAPYLSHLEPTDLQPEYDRCHSFAKSSPINQHYVDDELFQSERDSFFQCLDEALKTNRGVVAFHY